MQLVSYIFPTANAGQIRSEINSYYWFFWHFVNISDENNCVFKRNHLIVKSSQFMCSTFEQDRIVKAPLELQ